MDEAAPSALDVSFSSAKKRVLLFLKHHGEASLVDVASDLGVSRMAALKHLHALESRGLVERSVRPGGRGRPRAYFRLSGSAGRLFPEAYVSMTQSALAFIESKLGRDAVVELLNQRTQDLYGRYRKRFDRGEFRTRVAELAKIRDEGGYMAEVGSSKRTTIEMFEFNCPIRAVAENYWEACAAEVSLFRRLLRADVEASHRVVAGDPVCRFIIRKRPTEGTG